ncbi:hypothetical protein ARMGADRAFT_1027335 [Armillaria gallica]|uniref:Uncharacterized protein n=1 Tax=Armillaria gallica TaxID=47427 RepID=A0A2H3E2M5_ARMGA|nr:hypothetical protein ARMGADRAFT_1027335 [Armillaria gallica]
MSDRNNGVPRDNLLSISLFLFIFIQPLPPKLLYQLQVTVILFIISTKYSLVEKLASFDPITLELGSATPCLTIILKDACCNKASVGKPQSSATVSTVTISSTISFLVILIGPFVIFKRSEGQLCISGSVLRSDSECFHLSKGLELEDKELLKSIAASELKNDRRGEEEAWLSEELYTMIFEINTR